MTRVDREDMSGIGETEGSTVGFQGGGSCQTCIDDLEFIRRRTRPDYTNGSSPIRIVDLFAGGGGLTLGAAEAAYRIGRRTEIALAAEWDGSASDVYALNFPVSNIFRGDVAELFDGKLGAPLTAAERELPLGISDVDILLAGPPCQGHSDLNNHTRRSDPRNTLYLRAARAAEVLRPSFVIIENVPAVRHDKGGVVEKATTFLRAAGYAVTSEVLDLVNFGVPQRRRRHILLAAQNGFPDPAVVLNRSSQCDTDAPRSVEWAIADLLGRKENLGPDSPSKPTAENLARMRWLIDNDEYDLPNSLRPKCHRDFKHTYKAMYGRLRWDDPAPTITTGFGSMGQGRFVHPAEPRTLTPHEAARLQTLPDFFDLGNTNTRSTWAKVIGNAVPPLLGVHLVAPLLAALPRRGDSLDPHAASQDGSRVPALTSLN